MTMVSSGDLAQSLLLKSHTARLKGELGRLTQEFAAGRVSDVGATLNGDLTRLTSVSRARTMTAGYQSAAREASSHSAAMQSALKTIAETSGSLVGPLLTASQLNTEDSVALTGVDARGRLDAVLATMNISAGGRSLFSGQALDQPSVAGADTILTALRAELVGAVTAQQAMDRISDWFDDPAGYRALAYQGGVPLGPVAVSSTDRVWMGVTAEDPAFRAMLKGMTAAALLDDPATPLPATETKTLARLSAETLLAGNEAMITLAAQLGISEGRIEAAQSRNAVDLLAQEMAQADLVRSDPERLAIELEAVQTNLESVYAITARLSRMSLTDFLR
ncbi:MAG: flagellar biosynthesis protein FlgL [Pseudotabrizicola sp.]|uniref:flagellar biosynthesis protein FlgL n=1 Tax=Pseudotabrizicola sp. TaxID=2939647 RepID=UPI002715A8D6|nr:flagellar biosynthesis protein FlgL [Pseudotabrizicola sp.]MDO9637131.1 flagellar biosynthesis protein FlgL [Pseudotabrizicola sp.]